MQDTPLVCYYKEYPASGRSWFALIITEGANVFDL